MGGDYNMAPEKLTEWARRTRSSIHCTAAPTCHNNRYDFFIVHRTLTQAIVGVQTIDDLGGRPHFGSRILIDSRIKDDRTWALKKPAEIPGTLPAGCKQFEPQYDLAAGLLASPTKEKISQALKQWYDLAESEFIDMLGLDHSQAAAYRGRADGPTFVQKFAAATKTSEHLGSTSVSEKCRFPAAWGTVLLRTVKTNSPTEGARRHAQELRRKILLHHTWKVADKEAL